MIELVLYKNGEVYEEVTLNNIESRNDFDIVRRNLYCAYEGCQAKIEYVPKGKRIAHFKTWPMSDHTPECKDFFEREKQRARKRNLANDSVSLSDKQINNILRNFINSTDETEEEKQKRLEEQRARYRKRKQNPITDKSQMENTRDNRPTTDSSTETIEGTRAPSVRRRHNLSLLSDEDINTAIALYEEVGSISIEENRVIFTLLRGNEEVNVYFEENFFKRSALNMDTMFGVVKRYLDNGNLVELHCVGNVERRNGDLCLVINEQSHIRINKMTIEVFALQISNPELF